MDNQKQHSLYLIIDSLLSMNKVLIEQNWKILEMIDQEHECIKSISQILSMIDPDLVDHIMNA